MSGVSPVIKLLAKTKARAFSPPLFHSSQGENAPAAGQSSERGLRSWMKVFWFFFSKKNILRAGKPREKKGKRFFLKKEAKTFIRSAPKPRSFVHPIALAPAASPAETTP